eukprot:TRINITY_DN10138_c0_g1_i1.p1 TRINITY_DN10138_c0_g1~~TRINITY_DN10138_c0_g1_i1.p1  ORF type:complete len:302 (+),score=74.83 TRINITY_DN10138_c0_g1_i1:587-1492(+)
MEGVTEDVSKLMKRMRLETSSGEESRKKSRTRIESNPWSTIHDVLAAIEFLPRDILAQVLSLLDLQSLGRFAQTNKRFHRFVRANDLHRKTILANWAATDRQNKTLKLVTTLTGHVGPVLSIHSRNGFLASGSSDKTARVWNLANNTHVKLPGHSDTVKCVRFNLNGDVLATASYDKNVRIFKRQSLTHPFQVESVMKVSEKITSMEWNENYLITGGWDRTIRLWDLSEEKSVRFLRSSGAISAIQCDGATMTCSNRDSSLNCWDLRIKAACQIKLKFDSRALLTHRHWRTHDVGNWIFSS